MIVSLIPVAAADVGVFGFGEPWANLAFFLTPAWWTFRWWANK